jgi:hypothetical protein
MFSIIGGPHNGAVFSTLYRAVEAHKTATGWSECWTSDPVLTDGVNRLYLYPSEEDLRADEERAGVFIEYAA